MRGEKDCMQDIFMNNCGAVAGSRLGDFVNGYIAVLVLHLKIFNCCVMCILFWLPPKLGGYEENLYCLINVLWKALKM
jgi:hypothetical protein